METTTPDFGFRQELDEQLIGILRSISADEGQARWIIIQLIQTIMADYIDDRLVSLLTACDDINFLYAVCYYTDRPFLCTKRNIYFKILIRCCEQSVQVTNVFKVSKKDIADLKQRCFSIDKPDSVEKPPPILASPE